MPKEKLTLSVDKEVVEKAKKLGINISDITEKVLKGYTSAEKPNGTMYDAYSQLFGAIIPLLKAFGGEVKVAEETDYMTDAKGNGNPEEIYFSIFLESDGSFRSEPFGDYVNDIRKINQQDFLSPEKILSNLVDALERSKEANVEKMQQIMMAKRIVDAMSETLVKRPSAKSDEKG